MRKFSVKFIITIASIATFLPNTGFAISYKKIKETYHKSFNYEQQKDFKDAIRAIMPVYEAYPNGYTVNLRLGWLYYLLKKYGNSEAHYKKAIKSVPSSAEAKLGLSLPYLAQKRWKEVENLMYEILKTDFYNFYGNLRLAIALRNQGKGDLAEKVSRKMLALYPANVSFLTELGLDLIAQGKNKKAYSIFADVIVLDPENQIAKYYLGK